VLEIMFISTTSDLRYNMCNHEVNRLFVLCLPGFWAFLFRWRWVASDSIAALDGAVTNTNFPLILAFTLR